MSTGSAAPRSKSLRYDSESDFYSAQVPSSYPRSKFRSAFRPNVDPLRYVPYKIKTEISASIDLGCGKPVLDERAVTGENRIIMVARDWKSKEEARLGEGVNKVVIRVCLAHLYIPCLLTVFYTGIE